MRVCVRCKINKPISDFYYDITRGKPKSACRKCCQIREAEIKQGIIRPKKVITHKRCNRCKEVKPVSNFYIKYGYFLSLCKKCFIKSNVKHAKKWAKNNPSKIHAEYKANKYIKNTKPCEVCGELKVHRHHDDYNKPLDIRFLCVKHHKQYHVEHKLEEVVGG